ncbi:MAG: phytoene/squalene synthase family protein [Myxococcales bacterium]|nr:phytoene/squalene synthase family protein [Polyangiaceae bacterium]MDW8248770.1 phytoene/squalene synthase family protein [Myxococcales bacterium]
MNALDIAHCEEWIRTHSRSFYLASWLLPPDIRVSSWALYAFCRRSDDAVDEGVQGESARRRIANLRARLDLVYRPDGSVTDTPLSDPIDRSFATIARAHRLPRGLPEALLAGMEMDACNIRYTTLDELYLYCFRVASTVGLMMALAMDTIHPDALLRACELGVAMQLTNIARDVGEDARRGRVYLPDELLYACGTSREAVLEATFASWPIREAVRRLLGLADDFYRSADRGVAMLPPGCRLAISAARHIYAAIGDDLAAHHYDSITRRAHTSTARKMSLMTRAVPLALRPAQTSGAGPADALLSRWIREAGVLVP